MNILHIFACYKNLSGYSVRSRYIIKFQKRAGLKVDYVSIEDDVTEPVKTLLSNNLLMKHKVKVFSYLLVKVAYAIYYNRLLSAILNHKIQKFKPDIIHVHSPWQIATDTLKIIKNNKLKVPVVYEARGLWEETAVALGETSRKSLSYILAKRLEKYVLTNVDAVVSISEHLKNYIKDRGIDGEKILVIPNGVDTQYFKPLPKNRELMRKLGVSSQDIVVGYVGSIRRIEGLEYLIEAVKHISGIKLIIVGDGKYKGQLIHRAKLLKLGKMVKLLRSVLHKDISKYYSLIDIFVIPRIKAYVNEVVTPLKPLEAMSMRKCIIASNVGGLRELIQDNVTGILFKANSVEDLARKIKLATENDELRKSLGRNAREWVVKYRDWRNIVSKYIELYSSIT